MKKTYLIIGGASAVSLAAGAAGGYLFAKKRFEEILQETVAREVLATKKYYAIQLAEARSGKPEDPADIVEPSLDEQDHTDGPDEELTEKDKAVIAKGRKVLDEASKAMTDYQGLSASPGNGHVVTNNIFTTEAARKPKLPPRDDTGKFLPKSAVVEEISSPHMISGDDFLANDPEHEQESLLYFANEDTLVSAADYNEVIDSDLVGDNLSFFPDDIPSVIYIRNEKLHIDYQITRTHDNLTEALGLGESDADMPDEDHADEFADQD